MHARYLMDYVVKYCPGSEKKRYNDPVDERYTSFSSPANDT